MTDTKHNDLPSCTTEIIYHVFQRSFYDSNNDKHGDLRGLMQQLPYLQDLGITAILLTPLFTSPYYHNYFAEDFGSIDPAYGTMTDYFDFADAVHRHGMKLYLDMEIQYVTEDHIWFKDSFKNPASVYSDYVLYQDNANETPETIIFNTNGLLGYDGVYKDITTVNLLNSGVQSYMVSLFRYWMDPRGDGSFNSGADGFRLDHMMDMLDNKQRLSNLFSKFWKPLIEKLKAIKPGIVFIAEQTDWSSFGQEYLTEVGADKVFAFPLRDAILTFSKENISEAAVQTFSLSPDQSQNIVFIENHDTHRFATLADNHPGKLRTGAALNLLLGGTPAIYYGQEIGMTGGGGFGKYGNSDGNDIPRREAFKWYKDMAHQGMTTWYENSGPWWEDSSLQDTIVPAAAEEQITDPGSLWKYYQLLIQLKKKHPALAYGEYKILDNDSAGILSFLRISKEQTCMVLINLSDTKERAHIDVEASTGKKNILFRSILGNMHVKPAVKNVYVDMESFSTGVWEYQNVKSSE